MGKLSRYLLLDLLKNRIVLGSLLLFALIGWGVFTMVGNPEKSVIIILQATLFILPLISLIFSSIYYYNSSDFIVLLLSQPIQRGTVIRSIYTGITLAFILSYLVGIGLPLLLYYPTLTSGILLGTGILLITIFTGISLWISTVFHDRVKGIGLALIMWAFFAFIFDGLLLYLMLQFSDYPIEQPILVLTFLNPIDIARILVIMQTDASALLGLSGAVFREFFTATAGLVISLIALLLWAMSAYFFTQRSFKRKDL